MSAEVTRVVIRDGFVDGIDRRQASFGNKGVKELRVVDYFVHATQLGVFIGQRVEAVCTRDDNFLGPDFVERFHILHRQHLEEEFVTRTARGIA